MSTTAERPPALDPSAFDVIGAEVHRKAMEQIAREMGITLVRTSGSPVVTDARDLSCTVLDENNEQLGFSGFVIFHIATSQLAVEAILRNYDIEDIAPGDAFLANDPHNSGAIHQGDLGVVMPYFHDEELVGWGYVNEHLLDVGGSAVSGFAPSATDVFSEALRFPGIRIMRENQLSPDWELFISGNVRAPVPVVNDLRSMIASLHTGQRRYGIVLDEYGLDAHREFARINKALTEQMVRERVSKLPDGTYGARDWVEYDGQGVAELHELGLELEIRGDEMTLRFDGGPQAPSYINGAVPSVIGQAMTTLITMYFYDVPVNAGIWEPLHFDLGPQGTIVNSVPPAPVTQSHMETGMRINKLVANTLSQAMSLSPDTEVRGRVSGQPNNGACTFVAAGVERATGRPSVIFPVSPAGGLGGPAQTIEDGLDTYSTQCTPGFNMPSVETDESSGPLLVLWRRILPSSGGPGEHRGGLGMKTALAIRGAEEMTGATFNGVAEVPPGGFAGGYPGAASHYHLLQETSIPDLIEKGIVITPENLEGKVKKMPAKTGNLVIRENEVFDEFSGGGGGLGDPLLRSPHRVAVDIRDGYVTEAVARKAYGVVVDESGGADQEATEQLRSEMRRERLGSEPPKPAEPGPDHEIGVSVRVKDRRWWCSICSEDLGDIDDNFRKFCVERSHIASELFESWEMHLRPRTDPPIILLNEYFCPGCGSCVTADVTAEGEELRAAPLLTDRGVAAAEKASQGTAF